MANKALKGITIEIGGDTTKLDKALQNVNKKAANLSSELGEVNRLLKLDPGNADLLAQKQQILADAVANTQDKLDALREAEKQVQAQFERGEVSEEQYRALQREIIATEQKLDSYTKAAAETADELEKLGAESDNAAEQVDDVGDSADNAEDSTRSLGDAMNGPLVTGLKAAAAAAGAVATALVAAAESTRDYRTAMGKLNTAFETNGHTAEAATETYKELQSILGDSDQAVEAANHLAKLTDNTQDLQKWTDICTGVYATFGDSLPIEGLTEAANETAKVAKVTGPLADAINWSTSSTEDWTDALGGNKKALAAFTKATSKGESAEDAFNEALAACSTEQERQKLITQTLTKLYKGAATEYKRTNKTVIEANKANEEWNATLAELGAEMDPLLTDIKKMGTSLLQDAHAPLKKVIDYVRDTVLPALTSAGNWVASNLPAIKAGLAGVVASLVAFEVASISATVAQNGLKGAIMATAAAQKIMDAATKATPWGLVATAVTGVITALALYVDANKEAEESVDALTEEERELLEATNEAAQAFSDQMTAGDKNAQDGMAQLDHVQKLADELYDLAGASGVVKEKDRERAEFILGELNTALGTEFEMVGNMVSGYWDLKESITAAMEAKKANILLESYTEAYTTAIKEQDQLYTNMILKEKDYQAQKAITKQAEKEYADAVEEFETRKAAARTAEDQRALAAYQLNLQSMYNAWQKEEGILDEKETAWNESAATYGEASTLIGQYEDAQTAVLNENYEKAIGILANKENAYNDFADDVDDATAEVLGTLKQEAIDAGLEAERTKSNFEKGVDGYTKEMVDEAEKGYKDALDEFSSAYADAYDVGEDLGAGMAAGSESKRGSLISKAKSLVNGFIAAARRAADSHSPSRKMIAFGEDLGEGAEIGLENSTKGIVATAKDQMAQIMKAYTEPQDVPGQAVYRDIQQRTYQAQAQSYQATAGSTAAKLDKILAAIERGQVLTIDGDQLVGATADRIDNKLGQRRQLAARGAL